MKALFPLILLFFVPSAFAQTASLGIEGTCREFNVTVSLHDFSEGCYDVKVDVTTPSGRVGRVFDPREGWKSSVYYVNNGLCIGNGQSGSGTFQLLADTRSTGLNFRGTVRQGSRTWDTDYHNIINACPIEHEADGVAVIFVSIICIELFILGFVIWDIVRKSHS